MKQRNNPSRISHDEDPVRILMEEHEQGIIHLKKLEDAAGQIRANGFSFDAFRDIAEASRFIDTVIREHDEREEHFLFPLMERHMNGEVEVLRKEHRELWREFKTFLECVSDVENMKIHTNTVRDLIQSAMAVAQFLRYHFTKEDEYLFSLAKDVLPPDEYQQLLKNISSTKTTETRSPIA